MLYFYGIQDDNSNHIYADDSTIINQMGTASVIPTQLLTGKLPSEESIFRDAMLQPKQ